MDEHFLAASNAVTDMIRDVLEFENAIVQGSERLPYVCGRTASRALAQCCPALPPPVNFNRQATLSMK